MGDKKYNIFMQFFNYINTLRKPMLKKPNRTLG